MQFIITLSHFTCVVELKGHCVVLGEEILKRTERSSLTDFFKHLNKPEKKKKQLLILMTE